MGGLYSFLCCLSLHNYPACRVASNELNYQRLSQSPAECRQLVFLWLLVRLLLELLIVAGFRKSVHSKPVLVVKMLHGTSMDNVF